MKPLFGQVLLKKIGHITDGLVDGQDQLFLSARRGLEFVPRRLAFDLRNARERLRRRANNRAVVFSWEKLGSASGKKLAWTSGAFKELGARI